MLPAAVPGRSNGRQDSERYHLRHRSIVSLSRLLPPRRPRRGQALHPGLSWLKEVEMPFTPFNFRRWLANNAPLLKPPVSNRLVFENAGMVVQVIGGPNQRVDFYDDPVEEFFYQLKGDMVLKIAEDRRILDVPIREGEVLLIPPHTRHSPAAGAGLAWPCGRGHAACGRYRRLRMVLLRLRRPRAPRRGGVNQHRQRPAAAFRRLPSRPRCPHLPGVRRAPSWQGVAAGLGEALRQRRAAALPHLSGR